MQVTGCQFHSYSEGIRCLAGSIQVSSCQFTYCGVGVVAGNVGTITGTFDYSDVNALWVWYVVNPTKISITGSQFTGGSSSEGIAVYNGNDSFSDNALFAGDCQFSGLLSGLNLSHITLPTVSSAWNSISVHSCSFDKLSKSAVYGSDAGTNTGTNSPALGASNRLWVIDTFNYTGNTHHADSTVPLSSSIYAYLTAQKVNCNGNSWIGLETGGSNTTLILTQAERLNVLGNTFNDCQSVGGGKLNFFDIYVPKSAKYIINNNSIIQSGGSGINNVFRFKYLDTTDVGFPLTPFPCDLQFNNNEIDVLRANYVLLSRQDENQDNTEIWEWGNVVACNNNIKNTVTSIAGFAQYGNNEVYTIGGVDRGFLGSDYTGATPTPGYIGGLDFRRFRHDVGIGGSLNSSLVVDSNNISQESGSFVLYDTSANWDLNAKVSIRVSKWPNNTTITNNNVSGGSVIVKWTYMRQGDPGGSDQDNSIITIKGNTIWPGMEGCALDIYPATGWLNSFSSNVTSKYIILDCSGNKIITDVAASAGPTYFELYQVLRLWHPPGLTGGPGADNLLFCWTVKDNILCGTTMIIDGTATGADLALIRNLSAATNTFKHGFMQLLGNTRVGSSSSHEIDSILGLSLEVGNSYSQQFANCAVQFNATIQGSNSPNTIDAGTE